MLFFNRKDYTNINYKTCFASAFFESLRAEWNILDHVLIDPVRTPKFSWVERNSNLDWANLWLVYSTPVDSGVSNVIYFEPLKHIEMSAVCRLRLTCLKEKKFKTITVQILYCLPEKARPPHKGGSRGTDKVWTIEMRRTVHRTVND